MTTKPTFSLAFAPNPRSRPIMDGTIKPEGIELIPTASGPAETFHRQLTHQEFDVSEMSLSSLAIITAQGNRDWVTLPICTTRTFFGVGALVRTDVGIESPPTSRGSAWASTSTSRRRRSGRAASSSTSTASRPRTWSGGWSARRS